MSRDNRTEIVNDLNMHCVSLSEQFCGEMSCNACISNWLYNAGYRKSSDLAEEIFADIHNTLLKVNGVVSEGLERSVRHDNEEAIKLHAGVLEIIKCLIPIFAELKKKYTEEKLNG